MYRRSIAVLAGIVALTGGCADGAPIPTQIEPVVLARPGNGNGGGSGGAIAASLAFRSFYINADGSVNDPGSDPDADRALADVDASYVDGQNGVLIAFESDRLRFQPREKRSGTRSLFLDFGKLVEGSSDPFGEIQELSSSSQLTVKHDLLSMADAEVVVAGANFQWQQSPRDPVFKLNYGQDGMGDPVTITRSSNDDGTSTWTVESFSTETAVLQDVSASGSPILGSFHVPFRISVVR